MWGNCSQALLALWKVLDSLRNPGSDAAVIQSTATPLQSLYRLHATPSTASEGGGCHCIQRGLTGTRSTA